MSDTREPLATPPIRLWRGSRMWHNDGMRSFRVAPTEPGVESHHFWTIIAIAEDGSESVAGTYETMTAALAAKDVLDQQESDIHS